MALKAKVRGQWRVVSKAMARRFRARGVNVVDTAADAVAPMVAPTIDDRPLLPVMVAFRKSPNERVIVSPPTPPAPVAPMAAGGAFDLTDDELERLTAPDGEE